MPLHIRGTPISAVCIILALLSSMGGFIFGYDTGQISDIVTMPDFLQRFADTTVNGELKFSNVREGLIVGMLSIGTLVGALIGRYFSDWLGRKKAITVFSGVFCVGCVIQTTAFQAWYQVMIGRIVAGLGVGALSAAVPVYQSETVPKQIRGTLIATYQLMITFGILVSYLIAYGTSHINNSGAWRTVIAIGIAFGLFLGIGIMFMPESPRWLIAHGREDEALNSLARVRGTNEDDPLVQADLNEIIDAHELSKRAGNGSWLECFIGYKGGKKTAYRTFLVMILQMFQQLTGANYFFYYGATIFQGVGITNAYITQIILGAVNFGCTFLGLWIMERFGRRNPLIIGGLWQSAWLFVFGAIGTKFDPQENASAAKVMIVAACLFILGYASTWGPGIWILVGETFAQRNRARQAALATASNWLWNFLLAFFTPFITASIGYTYGFVFAGCNLAAAIFVFFFLYESAGISLEAVNTMYGTDGLKAWQSSKWAPEGYDSRADARNDTKKTETLTSHMEHAGERRQRGGRGRVDSDDSDITARGDPRVGVFSDAEKKAAKRSSAV